MTRTRHNPTYAVAILAVLLTLTPAVFAADAKPTWKGTIAVTGDKHSETELKKLAKISQADAAKRALAAVSAKSKKIQSSELEAENGYLIYSFDIKIKGKDGIEEVVVDAGSGKVLAHEHESSAAEAKEEKEEKNEKGEKGEKHERK